MVWIPKGNIWKELTLTKDKKPKKRTPVCAHNKIGYSALVKLTRVMSDRSKQDEENIKKLTEILHSQKQTID